MARRRLSRRQGLSLYDVKVLAYVFGTGLLCSIVVGLRHGVGYGFLAFVGGVVAASLLPVLLIGLPLLLVQKIKALRKGEAGPPSTPPT